MILMKRKRCPLYASFLWALAFIYCLFYIAVKYFFGFSWYITLFISSFSFILILIFSICIGAFIRMRRINQGEVLRKNKRKSLKKALKKRKVDVDYKEVAERMFPPLN